MGRPAASRAGAGPNGPGRTAAGRSAARALREAAPQVRRRARRALQPHAALLATAPQLRLDLPRLERAPADREPQRHAEQLRVGELRARPGVAVVVEHVEPALAQLAVEPLGQLALVRALLAEPDQLDVEGRHRSRPGDALLVGELLHRGRGDAGWAEPVGAHPDQLLGARLVQVGGAERLGEARAELEDVAGLDRRLDPDRVAVHRVARLDGADVDALEAEVAAGLDAAQVRVRAVRAGHVAARGDALVEQDRHVSADWADVAGGAD